MDKLLETAELLPPHHPLTGRIGVTHLLIKSIFTHKIQIREEGRNWPAWNAELASRCHWDIARSLSTRPPWEIMCANYLPPWDFFLHRLDSDLVALKDVRAYLWIGWNIVCFHWVHMLWCLSTELGVLTLNAIMTWRQTALFISKAKILKKDYYTKYCFTTCHVECSSL